MSTLGQVRCTNREHGAAASWRELHGVGTGEGLEKEGRGSCQEVIPGPPAGSKPGPRGAH